MEVTLDNVSDAEEDEDKLVVSRPRLPITSSIQSVGLLGDDPALWPEKLTDAERCSIVRQGPVQIQTETETFP